MIAADDLRCAPPAYPPCGDRLFGLPILPYAKRPVWWKRGVTRECFLIGRYAVKIPSLFDWRHFLQGLLANMQEREIATMRAPEYCPIVFSSAGGWLVVMRRAVELSDDEWRDFMRLQITLSPDIGRGARDPIKPWIDSAADHHIAAELKRDSFGMLDGRIVAVDYGN